MGEEFRTKENLSYFSGQKIVTLEKDGETHPIAPLNQNKVDFLGSIKGPTVDDLLTLAWEGRIRRPESLPGLLGRTARS